MPPVLDRRVQFDERSRAYPIRALLAEAPPRSKAWGCQERLNQGQQGACVGFGWSHEQCARPRPRHRTNEYALKLYHRAQQLDDIPDTESGSSVLAGAQALTEWRKLREYRWAFGIQDVIDTLAHHGPVVLGIPWLQNMFNPGPGGLLDVSGPVVGGHCILARGVKIHAGRETVIIMRNSWGAGWGHKGDCLILASSLAGLLAQQGEACVPVKA